MAQTKKTEAPKTEAPKTEAPKTEAPKTEAPKASKKSTSTAEMNVSVDGERKTIKVSDLDIKKHKHLSGRDFTSEEVETFKKW